MHREIIAFIVAALAIPALVAGVFYRPMPNDSSYAFFLSIVAVISFIVVPVLGVPAYRFLQAKGWTAFWIAPLVGFVVATVVWYVVQFLFGLLMVPDKAYVLSSMTRINLLQGVLWPIGPIGAVVGSILWLIARPDRAKH
jgi:hypothetical protein